MKIVLQIVNNARVEADNQLVSSIQKGLVVYFCVEKGDTDEKLLYMADRIKRLRIFPDKNGKTNLNINDFNGEILLISQFTLAGNFYDKNRPDFINAENFDIAKDKYFKFSELLKSKIGVQVKLGAFGKDMNVIQENAGPFTAYLQK